MNVPTNPSVTQAFKTYYDNFLSNPEQCNHNYPALLARWGEDPSRFETQILCNKNGTPVPDSNKFEQGGELWGPIRWPYDSYTNTPHYSDPPITFIIPNRLKAIGSTWWDWKNKRSFAVGFDFDSLIDHDSGAGIPQSEIRKLDQCDVPYLEIIKSTRGNGRHLYIRFEEPYPVANNHYEHKAVARSLMSKLQLDTGFDFSDNVDCYGMILWFYHLNATPENQGYSLVKPATEFLTANDLPPNWEDNIEVVSGGRTRVRVQGWTPDGISNGDPLDEMTQAYAKTPLDETHMRILEALEGTGHTSLWVFDHHLWQGHTAGLKQVFDEFAEKGTPLRGLFDTNSGDTDPGKPNCFARPKPEGAWDVYRFGDNIEEHPLWDRHGKWTHITYNFPATLKQICIACGGYEGTEEKQGFLFDDLSDLKAALKMLNASVTLPDEGLIEDRAFSLHSKSGTTVLVIEKKRNDKNKDFRGFAKTPRGWERKLTNAIKTPDEELKEDEIWSKLDNQIRALKVEGADGDQFDGWVAKDESGAWVIQPKENIKSLLSWYGYTPPEPLIGSAIYKMWKLVSVPFGPEYPGNRVWNRNSVQFAYSPVELKEGEVPHHPTWTRVMEHCGVELNEYIPNCEWCKEWGINTGGDYLTAWVACMCQNPFCKLPYLFFYGPQNSGKSSFHEALSLLFTKGVVNADRALTSEQGYNGELMGAILGVVDEVDVAKSGSSAYNKLKQWITGLQITIHEKYKTPKDIPSTLHLVQMANDRGSLPVLPGDTRITVMNVPSLEEEIPKDRLIELLSQEAPHFMRTVLDYDLPEASGRTWIPLIETQGKFDAMSARNTHLEDFIEERCYQIPGAVTKLEDFKKRFHDYLGEESLKADWSGREIRNKLSEKFPVAVRSKDKTFAIGNLSFNAGVKPSTPYIVRDSKLVLGDFDV